MTRYFFLAFGCLLLSCFRSGATQEDAGTLVEDDAREGGDAAVCTYLGTHQVCDRPECSECLEARSQCFQSFICDTQDDMNRPKGCFVDLTGLNQFTGHVSFDERACLQRRNSEFAERVRGPSVDPEVCEYINAERSEEFACRYFDGTEYENGPPPVAECPELAPGFGGEGRLCGGACGECPEVTSVGILFGEYVSCVGINEERGYGVCAMLGNSQPVTCQPAPGIPEEELWRGADYWGGFGPDGETLRRATCMRLLQDDGTPHRAGWIVMEDTCLTYVENFPGTFECSRTPE